MFDTQCNLCHLVWAKKQWNDPQQPVNQEISRAIGSVCPSQLRLLVHFGQKFEMFAAEMLNRGLQNSNPQTIGSGPQTTGAGHAGSFLKVRELMISFVPIPWSILFIDVILYWSPYWFNIKPTLVYSIKIMFLLQSWLCLWASVDVILWELV